MSLLEDARHRFNQEGIAGMLDGGVSLINNKMIDPAKQRYWLFRGRKSLAVGDISAKFIVDSPRVAGELSYFINHEVPILADLLSEIGKESVVFDIGAHMGVYSIMASLAGAQVYAIEPYPPNTDILRKNININAVNVQVVETAVGKSSGKVKFINSGTIPTGSACIAINDSSGGVILSKQKLDELVTRDGVPKPDILKIDVEGAEGLVLEGGQQTVPDCQLIYLELHYKNSFGASVTDHGYSPTDVLDMLEDSGFIIETLAERSQQKVVKATNYS